MRTIGRSLAVLLLISPLAHASVDEALTALHESGETLKSLSADLSLHSGDADIGDDKTKFGRFVLQRLPDGDMRLRATFDKTKSGNNVTSDKTTYLLDKTDLIERDYQQKKETIRQVRQPGEKLDLFKLGEGPFPLPIGQKPADVLRDFDVSELKTTDPAALALIKLTPKRNTPMAAKFKWITVLVDRTTHLPKTITTADTNEADIVTVRFDKVAVDGPVGDGDFQLEQITTPPWNRVNTR